MARFRAGRSDCGELAAKAHISDPARKSENVAKACGTIDDITCGTIDDIKGKSSQSVTRMLETESRDRVRSLPSLGASLCVMRDSWIGFKCRAGDGLRWAVCQRQRHCARRTVDRPSPTRSKTSGSSPATTGSPIAYSNPMTVVDHCCFAWIRLVDQPWTICPSTGAIGHIGPDQRTWYKGGEHTRCETPLGSLPWSDFAAHRRQLGIFG